MIKLLVIDDEDSIRRTLRLALEPKGFAIEEAASGQAGLELAKLHKPQLILLDLGLPDLEGMEVLKQLRSWTATPIIVLTANDDESTKVTLLEMGADDYVTKPFSTLELNARINVALRHYSTHPEETPVFESGRLRVELANKKIERSGQLVKLTATEFQLLAELVKARGQVVPQDHLLKSIWGPNAVDKLHYLRIYIGALRKKIEENASLPTHILTEPGVGYRIV